MRLKHLIESGLYSRPLLLALGVGLVYLSISVAWILISDYIAARISADREALLLIQQYKGIAFVIVMTAIISWLVHTLQQRDNVLKRTLEYTRTDSLTGLANRAVAEEYLDSRLQSSTHDGFSCGVLLFDIRELSRINRSIGRTGGDQLLTEVAHRIKSKVRPADLVARLESDRFIVILGPLVTDKEALETGIRILSAFDTPILIDSVEIHVELRGGAALASRDGATTFELLDAAERALYRSKQHGHGIHLANQDDLIASADYLERENLLRHAIRERQFSIALQPQISLNNKKLVGAEALARWNCPGKGEIPPNEFIPLAESLGLIEEITQQILEAVGDCVGEWIEKDLPQLQICVNLSGLDLKSGRILEVVQSFLDRSRIPGHLLTLEITESWLMEDPNLALGLIHRLRKLGPRIAIDDFGTGYSAFSQLIDFPFDFVKFDRSLVAGVDHSPKKAKVLSAVQRMVMTLGAQTIAEGVETIGELALLEELGLDEVQGFLFDRAIPAAEFEARYLNTDEAPFMDILDRLEQYTSNNKNRAVRLRSRRDTRL